MRTIVGDIDASILIIDDDYFVRDFAVHTIEFSINCKVAVFDSGFRAWQHIQSRSEQVRVVVADVNIPDINGLELLERLKASYPEIIFVLTSGNPSYEKAADRMGADAFLAKPFNIDDLFVIVDQFVVEPSAESTTER